MDEIDQNLISALRRNSRASVSQLAAALDVSRATVRSRMDRLVAEGEILGFTIVVKSETRELPVRGITLIQIEGKGTERIINQINGMPDVQSIYTTNGRWDLIVELAAKTLPELDDVLKRIRLIDGISASETSLYLSAKRSRPSVRAQC
jgi:DNA-binding Lrp family transcriptional regulator